MWNTLIFGSDSDQAERLQRLLFIAASYPCAALCIRLQEMLDVLAPHPSHWQACAAATLACLALYGVMRSGLNLRAADPDLTFAQVCIALGANTWLVIHAGPQRGAFLVGYVLIAAVCTFRLGPRAMLLTGSSVLLICLTVIGIEQAFDSAPPPLSAGIAQCGFLSLIFGWFALLSHHWNASRRRQQAMRLALGEALRQKDAALRSLRDQVIRDELTGLFNRRYLMEALRVEHNRAERTGESFCLLMLDIDHFKSVNDSVGHQAGDRVLAAVADTVADGLRSIDLVGRYGGEEFLVLMPATSLTEALQVAERVRRRVEGGRIIDAGTPVRVTVSIGAAQHRAGMPIAATIREADRALYRAKHRSRNCVEHSGTVPFPAAHHSFGTGAQAR